VSEKHTNKEYCWNDTDWENPKHFNNNNNNNNNNNKGSMGMGEVVPL
jgi:hypothetical protein